MASKITGLPLQAAPLGTDLIEIAHDPSGTPASQKATLSSIVGIGSLVPSILISAQTDALTFTAIAAGAALSLVGWFYFTGPNLSNYSPIWFAGSGPDSGVYYGDGAAASKLTIIKSGTRILTSTTNLPATNSGWHLVVLTDNGSVLKAYVDGVDIGNSVVSYTTMSGISFTSLNQGLNSNNYFGYISECAIFSRALSAAEVTALYNGGAGVYPNIANAPFSTGLVAGWHMNEGGRSTITDYSGNGHTLALVRGNTGENGARLWAPLANIIRPV